MIGVPGMPFLANFRTHLLSGVRLPIVRRVDFGPAHSLDSSQFGQIYYGLKGAAREYFFGFIFKFNEFTIINTCNWILGDAEKALIVLREMIKNVLIVCPLHWAMSSNALFVLQCYVALLWSWRIGSVGAFCSVIDCSSGPGLMAEVMVTLG